MNPPLPLPVLVPLLLIAAGLVAWSSWRGTGSLPARTRGGLLALRLLAAAGLAALLLNPGAWVRPQEQQRRPWLVLLDRSASMAQPSGESTRIDLAARFARIAVKKAASAGIPLRVHAYDTTPGPALEAVPESLTADGAGSDLAAAARRLIDDASAAGENHAGIIALGDGRQTRLTDPASLESLALLLRSRGCPLHSLCLGAGDPTRDLSLHVTRPSITAFTGQHLRIPVVVESSGLGPLKPELVLLDAKGGELARQQVETFDGKPAFATFEVPVPPEPTRWTITTATLENETNPGNNASHVNLRLLSSKTRVFLAEGAPYWDSKFLAQLLRQQAHMEVHSVHRISDERYFRIDTGEAKAADSDAAIFPDSLAELSRYDLVVFGKNIDSFLTEKRLEALRSYVRDHGGAVLFARGRAATGNLPALEPLEPVSWAAGLTSEFRFIPGADGEAAGLFGEALPAPGASTWQDLPLLKDGHRISMVKPFTRVLAHGRPEGVSSATGDFPVLLVRRYGQGVTGLVNGDGLWKWDFFPEARLLGNMYEDFWTQLIQWMASYSEFLPGQDFSLRLPALRGPAGEAVAASMSFRGSGTPPPLRLRVTSPDGSDTDLSPAEHPDPGGHPQWRASFTPDTPGTWKLAVLDPRPDAPPAPEALFTVPAPPAESDKLAADPAFLASLAEASGGTSLTAESFAAFLDDAFTPAPPEARDAAAVWQPAWTRWPFALLIALPFASEWWIRRRQGLA